MNSSPIQNNQAVANQMVRPRPEKAKGEGQEEKAVASARLTQDTYVPSQSAMSALAEEVSQEETAVADQATSTEAAASQEVSESSETTKTEETDDKAFNRALAQELKMQQAEQKIAFLGKISEMFTSQSISMLRGDGIWAQIAQGDFEVTEAESAEAAEETSEDGYWGVEQTSQRIFAFAQALAGEDPSKAEEMFGYVMKGFEAAEKAWGGELPEIAQQTMAATEALFDEWKNSGSTTGVVVD